MKVPNKSCIDSLDSNICKDISNNNFECAIIDTLICKPLLIGECKDSYNNQCLLLGNKICIKLATQECMDISLNGDFCKKPSTHECINLDFSTNCRDKITNNCNLITFPTCVD
jgi:hypothetical protein